VLPNLDPHKYTVYTTLKFLALQGAPYIYIYIHDISRIRVSMEPRSVYFMTEQRENWGSNIFRDK
jgi:hypothetical protein